MTPTSVDVLAGETPVSVPEKNRRVNVERILEAVTDRTRLVFVANPGNPTGVVYTADELAMLRELALERLGYTRDELARILRNALNRSVIA